MPCPFLPTPICFPAPLVTVIASPSTKPHKFLLVPPLHVMERGLGGEVLSEANTTSNYRPLVGLSLPAAGRASQNVWRCNGRKLRLRTPLLCSLKPIYRFDNTSSNNASAAGHPARCGAPRMARESSR